MSRRAPRLHTGASLPAILFFVILFGAAIFLFKDSGKFGDGAYIDFGRNFRTNETLVDLQGYYSLPQLETVVKAMKEGKTKDFQFPKEIYKKPNQ